MHLDGLGHASAPPLRQRRQEAPEKGVVPRVGDLQAKVLGVSGAWGFGQRQPMISSYGLTFEFVDQKTAFTAEAGRNILRSA